MLLITTNSLNHLYLRDGHVSNAEMNYKQNRFEWKQTQKEKKIENIPNGNNKTSKRRAKAEFNKKKQPNDEQKPNSTKKTSKTFNTQNIL